MYGLKKKLADLNLCELRNMFASYNKSSWYRFIKEVNKVKLPIKNNMFKPIRDCIVKLKAVKLNKLI